MKITSRTLIPVFVLVLLALGAVGVASASGLAARAMLFQEQDEVEIFGSVEQITPNFVTVNGEVIRLTSQTEFKNEIVMGDFVKVHALLGDDGALTAREVELSLPAAADDNSNDNMNGDDDNSNMNDNINDGIDDDDNSNMNENSNDDIDDDDNSNTNNNSNDDSDDDDNSNSNSNDDSDDDDNSNRNDNGDDDDDDDD